MSTPEKGPDKAGGDSSETKQQGRDGDATKKLNDLFDELATPRDSLDVSCFVDFDRFCPGFDQQQHDLAEQLESQGLDQHRTLTEIAERFKTKGNKFFKEKKYQDAVRAYTQGLDVKCPDKKLNSILYSNRAAAYKQAGDLKSAFVDCVYAIKCNVTNYKAAFRGAECLAGLGYDHRETNFSYWIDIQYDVYEVDAYNEEAVEFRKQYAREQLVRLLRRLGLKN